MRVILSAFVVVLLLIAIFGLGAGIVTVVAVAKQPGAGPLGVVLAVVYGSIPFAIGTVALGACAIVAAVDLAGRDQVAAINRGSEIALNEARHAQHHREARGQ